MNKQEIFDALELSDTNSGACGAEWFESPTGPVLDSYSPIDGELLARVQQASADDYEQIVGDARRAFDAWRMVPAPRRGLLVRDLGDELRRLKEPLGHLVTLEMGKSLSEGLGEVQEMIDMADFAVGLSRQLYGLTMHSERPEHRMYEQWHPLGTIGIITSFNFPAAVWAWNSMVAAVAGDTMIWKPSSKTTLTAVAVQKIAQRVARAHSAEGLFSLAAGRGADIGERMIADRRLPLISATGSVEMGRRIGAVVGGRLGSTILELGGNNALVVAEDAQMDMAVSAVFFGALGTAGQRCTSTRRVLVHEERQNELVERLVAGYQKMTIGDPRSERSTMGPLVDAAAVDTMRAAIEEAIRQGGELLYGGERLEGDQYRGGAWVRPAIVRAQAEMPILQTETFAPLVYIVPIKNLDEAIAVQNGVPQGLSSSLFTESMRKAEQFLSHAGSDCGIANVNVGTSGAEIGGAFGGEKDTGGGREAGSDAWKAYMRRQTCTISWAEKLAFAQGVEFEL